MTPKEKATIEAFARNELKPQQEREIFLWKKLELFQKEISQANLDIERANRRIEVRTEDIEIIRRLIFGLMKPKSIPPVTPANAGVIAK